MSQGYGQQSNPTDPYGQSGAQGSPSAAPAYGSPAPAPGFGSPSDAPAHGSPAGYPGTTGAATTAGGTAPSSLLGLTKWMLILAIAVVAIRAILGIIGFGTGFAIGAAGTSVGVGTAALLLSLATLLVNGLVSLGLLVVAVIVAIQAKGRGRTGAIIIAAAIIVSIVLYWIVFAIRQVGMSAAADSTTLGIWGLVYIVAEVLRWLLISAALIVGALMARRWAKQNVGTAQAF